MTPTVKIAQRWILARLRNETFFSIEALNERIWTLFEELNKKQMRVSGVSRSELFERVEKSALLPMPSERFTYAEWKKVRVNIDYHVAVDGHFYSAPYELVREELEARFTSMTVELYRRIASHERSYVRGGITTKKEHMPKAPQKHVEWTPSRITHWAGAVGIKTKQLLEAILADRPHPEMGYRSCLWHPSPFKEDRHGNRSSRVGLSRATRASQRF